MKRSLILTLLAVGACGVTVAPQPVAPQPVAPELQPVLFSGTYVGEETCTLVFMFQAEIQHTLTDISLVTVTFSAAGVPLLGHGGEQVVGEEISATDSGGETKCTIVNITQSENAVVIHRDCVDHENGDNSCQRASDGVCDEIRFCNFGTDFADCGPVEWEGSTTLSYLMQDDGSVLFTESNSSTEVSLRENVTSWDCIAVLTR